MMLYRQFATQEEIDKEYDVEKSAPDFQRYAEFNINESKKARDELECLLDVPFGPTVEETLDIFPAQDPDAAALAEISAALVGRPATGEVFADAGRRAGEACEPVTDVRGTAEYKRHLASELTIRTLRTAAQRVREQRSK